MIQRSDSLSWLFVNATVLDVERAELHPDQRVLVVDGMIKEVGEGEVTHGHAETVDLHGAVLMPGLIDGHVHVTAANPDLSALPDLPPSYTSLYAARELNSMLHRGFTTVRDCAGADFGLASAVDEGLDEGPRLLFAGSALSQTGGHGDVRPRGRSSVDEHYCCPNFGRICDGVDACRRAARDEIRKGADHIKLMLSGGVSSLTDRIDSTQFSVEEISAVVEEADAARRYVCGHAYLPNAIDRALRAGVRSIEHGNFLDESSAATFTETGGFLVPTLVTYYAIAKEGGERGMQQASLDKVTDVLNAGEQGLETAQRGGVDIVFGTDLLGGMHHHQLMEFRLRAQVQSPAQIIRSATATAARMIGREGELGVVAPGARADLLAVRRNPLEDIDVLADQTPRTMIMKGGRAVRLAA